MSCGSAIQYMYIVHVCKKEIDTSYSHKSNTDPKDKSNLNCGKAPKRICKNTFMGDKPFWFLLRVYSMVLPDTLIAHLLSQVGDVRTYYLERIDFKMVQVSMEAKTECLKNKIERVKQEMAWVSRDRRTVCVLQSRGADPPPSSKRNEGRVEV